MRLGAQLTPREDEIAELLAWGASKKEVAERLFISSRTVENTARNIYAKTGIQKATELCVWWFCTKCGVPVSLDPLRRAFTALFLLVIFGIHELSATDTGGYMLRANRKAARTAARVRAGRRTKEDNEISNLFDSITA